MYFNPYTAPAITSALLNICIGLYVFLKNPKKIQNDVFALLVFFFICLSIGEAMLGLSSTDEGRLLGVRIAYFGAFFIPLAALYLSFVFPQERTIFAKKRYAFFGLYIIPTVIFCIFNLMVTSQDIKPSAWGYKFVPGPEYSYIMIWTVLVGVLAVLNFFNSYIHRKTILEGKQIKQVFFGLLIVLIFNAGTNAIPPLFNIEVFPLGTVSFSIFVIFAASAIQRYDLFMFRPMIEPGLEEGERGPKRYDLKPGENYIVCEEGGKLGYKIFADQITHDVSGLCITKYPPERIRCKYGFQKTPIIWFTFKQSDEDTILDPKKTDIQLISQVEDFVKKIRITMIYIDCLDQISLVKGYEAAFKLISDIKKICEENHSTLLISIGPGLFKDKHLSILEIEFSGVI